MEGDDLSNNLCIIVTAIYSYKMRGKNPNHFCCYHHRICCI